MDVRNFLSTLIGLFLLSSCSKKTTETVFPEENSISLGACSGQAIKNKFIVQWEDGRFSVESADNSNEFKENFLTTHLEDIKKVEYDRHIQTKNSPSKETISPNAHWGQIMTRANELWAQGIYGQGVKIAVVDAFVDVTHAQIAPRISINKEEIPNNSIDDDGNGYIDDYFGMSFVSKASPGLSPSPHGTHVAGIIAADPSGGKLIGMAPQAELIPAQFIADDGGGSLGDAILAMQYAASRGAKIINASWGGAPCVSSLRDEFEELEKQGILVVVAAGNEGQDIDDTPDYPAAFNLPNQITVAASSMSDFMTSWSNSGYRLVHVAAPGENILSTIPGNKIASMDGTSMSAPFVSGAAALLWSAKPKATAVQIRKALLSSVDISPGHEFKVNSRGRINVEKALQELIRMTP